MKFSFKIFVSVILALVITLSVGSYLLVSSFFHSSLEKEIASAEKENTLFQYSLEIAYSTNEDFNLSNLSAVTETIESITSNHDMGFRFRGETFAQIYSNTDITTPPELLESIVPGQTSLVITPAHIIVQAYALDMDGEMIYVETYKNINDVFVQRQEFYDLFQTLMIFLILINSIIFYIVALLVSRPINKLAKTARQLASGNLEQRADYTGNDEIGMLAVDFNAMADKLETKIEDLEDARRRQDDFIASFAHELKTPLTSVIGYADLLRSRELPREQVFDAASYIFKEGKRLESLSFKLLDLIILKKQELDARWLDIATLVNESCGYAIPIESVEIQPARVLVDVDLFKTLLVNLLDNANKAIAEGGTISIAGKIEKDGYHLTIADTGIGMPKEELSKITDAFYMIDKSRTRKSGGAGLGLSLSQQIASLHGAQLLFASAPGAGTSATIIFKEFREESEDEA